jgi:hypothetical protein
MAGFSPEDWTILRSAGRDGNGDPIGTATELALPGLLYIPGVTKEMTVHADQAEADATIFIPAGSPAVQPTDQLRRPNGEVYDVIGRPQDYGAEGLIAFLRSVTG